VEPAHTGQYFEPHPAVPSRPRTVRLTLPDLTLDLASDGGVFSADALDEGTRYLLGAGPPLPPGATTLVDLGCGYGPIALTLARRAPSARVWALDVNARAVELTRANAARAQVDNVTALVVPTDPAAAINGLPEDLVIDALWSNPPIRVGKPVLHALLSYWLGRLGQHGEACLVVHKHLGADSLTTWLNRSGWPTTRLGSQGGYRILHVTRAPD
jgi:16S rRNA (guanine1207-N2)-methyltransferase